MSDFTINKRGKYRCRSGDIVEVVHINPITGNVEVRTKNNELYNVYSHGRYLLALELPEDLVDYVVEASPEAERFNEGKTSYAHLPMDLLDGAARVMEYGSKKYSRNNYRKGYEDLYSPLSSLIRHLVEVQKTIAEEDKEGGLDSESGQAHIHHVVTSALLLIHSLRLKGYNV